MLAQPRPDCGLPEHMGPTHRDFPGPRATGQYFFGRTGVGAGGLGALRDKPAGISRTFSKKSFFTKFPLILTTVQFWRAVLCF